MSGFAKGVKNVIAANPPQYAGLNLQTSALGRALPIVFGATLVAPNIIWYGDFTPIPHVTLSGGSSRGGKGGGGSKSSGSISVSYTFTTAVALGLCEGPIAGYGVVYADKTQNTTAALGFTEFLGTYPQTAWTYLITNHPSSAFGFNGIAHLDASAYDLGSSNSLPNHNVEVFGLRYQSAIAGVADADASLVVSDLLTNAKFGVPGFTWLGDLTTYQNYTIAAGLLISPSYDSQNAATSMIDDIVLVTNSEVTFSSGTLNIVPRGDETITANGKTYTPPGARYDLSDDDFLPENGSGSASSAAAPIRIIRKRVSDSLNAIQLECLNRSNQYQVTIVEAKDQAAIDQFGLRQAPSQTAHMLADPAIGRTAVQLLLQRQSIANKYYFATDARYMLLDPMDVVTLTHSQMGLDHVGVRITNMKKVGKTFQFEAEEYLAATGTAAQYSFAQGQGFAANYNIDPGNVTVPTFFEPSDQLAGGALEVWVATAGGPNWAGCEAWISNDGVNYRLLDRKAARARYGTLTAQLASVTPSLSPTIDNSLTLAVDISASAGQLDQGSSTDALALNTLCYVDGENIAYQTETLTGTGRYNLTGLVRGALGTTPALHASGSKFVRIDGALFRIPFTQDRIGSVIYVKFLSFNQYGAASQSLADVGPYAYTITGAALATPPADVTNLRTVYTDGVLNLWFDEIEDFRTIRYEIRKGSSFNNGLSLGDVAHPPFPTHGDGTYWVGVHSEPAPGLTVYSTTPPSVAITNSVLSQYTLKSYDEVSTGWTGAVTGSVTVSGSLIQTAGGGSGSYTVPTAHIIDAGFATTLYLSVTWIGTGQAVGSDFLARTDFLSYSDFLQSANAQFTDVWAEIRVGTGPDAALITWGAWQKFVPGAYAGRFAQARLQLVSLDGATQAVATAFTFTAYLGPRLDHSIKFATSAGSDSTITFTPDGLGTSAPFNAGPNGAIVPAIQGTIKNGLAGDDIIIVSESLSSVTFNVSNGGSRVVRNVDLQFSGF